MNKMLRSVLFVIMVVILFTAFSLLQGLVFKAVFTVEILILKVGLSFFVADMISALWLKPHFFDESEDEYRYNAALLHWMKGAKIQPWHIYSLGLLLYIVAAGLFPVEVDSAENPMLGHSVLYTALFGLVLAPIIETFLFQFCVIEVVGALTKKVSGNKYLIFAGIIAAVIFSLCHGPSINYRLCMFLAGLYLSFTYLFFSIRGQHKFTGYVSTVLMHFMMNIPPFVQMLVRNA